MYNQSGDIEIGNCKFIGISNNIRSDNYLSTEQRIFLVDFIVKQMDEKEKAENYSRVLSFIIGVIFGIINLYYATNDNTCVNISVERFPMNLRLYLILSGIILILQSLVVALIKKPICFIFIPFLLTFLDPFGIFIFFNIYRECSLDLYSYLMFIYFMRYITFSFLSFLLTNKIKKTFWSI